MSQNTSGNVFLTELGIWQVFIPNCYYWLFVYVEIHESDGFLLHMARSEDYLINLQLS